VGVSVDDNDTERRGGITGKGFVPGQSGNPGGQPAWVKRAREAMRDELYPAAQAHLLRVLTGRRPANARPEDDDMYDGVTVEDRTTAAKLVFEYALPKPKAQVGLKHEGKGGEPLSISINLEQEKP
jgi:hypothetical protein